MTPPLIKGGQGRSARSVSGDATALAMTILAILAVALCLTVERCRR